MMKSGLAFSPERKIPMLIGMSNDEAFDLNLLDSGTLAPNVSEKRRGHRGGRARKLRFQPTDYGRSDSLRHAVLNLVNEEEYSRAVARLEEYEESKYNYPQFKVRAHRYMAYAADLIHAIRAKRSFPGMENLAVTKQQELYDRAMEHATDLVATLKKVEQVDRECRAEDQRSTVWVIRAGMFGILAIMAVAFYLEISDGLLPTIGIVADDSLNRITNLLFDTLGF
jgi:hypothetical protein